MSNASGACFASGQYYGQVTCPSSSSSKKVEVRNEVGEFGASIIDVLPQGLPVSAASSASLSLPLLALAAAAVMALIA
jgi:hypothetical protein